MSEAFTPALIGAALFLAAGLAAGAWRRQFRRAAIWTLAALFVAAITIAILTLIAGLPPPKAPHR